MATVFDKLKIGNFEIKNRMAVAPTVKNISERDGSVNARTLRNYAFEADGPGLYIVSMTYTQEQGHVFKGQLGIQDELAVYGMAEVANRIHKAGAKTVLQLSHGGNLCVPEIIGETPVSASSIEQYPGVPVRTLTTEEVYEIADNYGKAAARAKEAGFDGVEMHACHGSMMMQFMSPIHNQGRTDIFKDGEEFLYECLRRVQEHCGKDFPIGVRLTCEEFNEEDNGRPGLKFDKVKEIAVEIEKMGVAYIHASAGRIGHTPDHAFPPLYEARGVNVVFAREIKKLVNIPVITVGRFQDPRLIRQVIERGDADIVAMCRPVIADPQIAKKVCDGNERDVRQCMGCNWCLEKLFIQESLECPMNPAYGWEEEYALKPATKTKDILVVGGGIAGMEAAFAAATRGHHVILCEKDDKLGGQVNVSSQYPSLYTRELWNLPRWLIRQMKSLSVDIRVNTKVTPELINEINPDAIIVATGAVEEESNLESCGSTNVAYLWDYLDGKVEVGKSVVVVGKEGVEAAANFANEKKNITLVQESEEIEWPNYVQGGGARREPLTRMLNKGKAELVFGAKAEKVTEEGLVINKDGKEQVIPCDTVIVADGRKKEDSLYESMKGKNRELYVVGDARDVGNMLAASHEGYWVGRTI